MLLKRFYKEDGMLDYLSIGHTGLQPNQNFSTRLVIQGMENGTIDVTEDKLTIMAYPENLVYTIKRRPGHYCLHCKEKLSSDDRGGLARLHVLEKHKGVASPDPTNRAGYEVLNHFECVLDSAQHDRFRLLEQNRNKPVRFPRKEQ